MLTMLICSTRALSLTMLTMLICSTRALSHDADLLDRSANAVATVYARRTQTNKRQPHSDKSPPRRI